MIYQYTGQPGHGKTLHAIKRALEFKEKGRIVYVCNVRDFDYEKTGTVRMEPADFRDWMNFLPDGAVCLVDECYEKDMLPKRGASQKLPDHVERLATHRHKGLDFIFVCQSPDKQMDSFVHDLIEEHVHVRRKFGTQWVNLRKFDRYERNPEKTNPIIVVRQRLPKEIFGLYKSTELDTTEKKVPWYIWAFAVGVPVGLAFVFWTFSSMDERLTKRASDADIVQGNSKAVAGGDGAIATATPATTPAQTAIEFIERFTPRVVSQPWSAPAYDALAVPDKAPRVFCMSSAPSDADDYNPNLNTCTCKTEQGTRYVMDKASCFAIAKNGQYEPYFDEAGQVTDARSYSDESYRQLDQAQATRTMIEKAPRNGEIFPLSEGYKSSSSYLELPVAADPNG